MAARKDGSERERVEVEGVDGREAPKERDEVRVKTYISKRL